MEVINQILPGILEGASSRAKAISSRGRRSASLMAEHARVMGFVARYIGGSYEYRDHKGDPNGRPPFVVVEAKKQRDALALFDREVFGPEAYQIPTKLYNYLAPSHWTHWGQHPEGRPDVAIHELVLQWQDQVLSHILAPITLSRLLDSEMKVPADQDVFQAAELLQGLTLGHFPRDRKAPKGPLHQPHAGHQQPAAQLAAELLPTAGRFAPWARLTPRPTARRSPGPELEALETRLKQVLAGKAELDTYTHAHLSDLVGPHPQSARCRDGTEGRRRQILGGRPSSLSAATPKSRPSDSLAWRCRRFQMK